MAKYQPFLLAMLSIHPMPLRHLHLQQLVLLLNSHSYLRCPPLAYLIAQFRQEVRIVGW